MYIECKDKIRVPIIENNNNCHKLQKYKCLLGEEIQVPISTGNWITLGKKKTVKLKLNDSLKNPSSAQVARV